MKERRHLIGYLAWLLCAALLVTFLDTIPDPPATTPHHRVARASLAPHIQAPGDDSLAHAKVAAAFSSRLVVQSDQSTLFRSARRAVADIALTHVASDSSPPVAS